MCNSNVLIYFLFYFLNLSISCDGVDLCEKSGNEVFYTSSYLSDIKIDNRGGYKTNVEVIREKFTKGIKVEISYKALEYLEKSEVFNLTTIDGQDQMVLFFEDLQTNIQKKNNGNRLINEWFGNVILMGLFGSYNNNFACFFGVSGYMHFVRGEELCAHSVEIRIFYSELEFCSHQILYDKDEIKQVEFEKSCTSVPSPSSAPTNAPSTSTSLSSAPTSAPSTSTNPTTQPTLSPTSVDTTNTPTDNPSKTLNPTLSPILNTKSPTRSPGAQLIPKVEIFEKVVPQSDFVTMGPFISFTMIKVAMNGTKDADLYVKFGSMVSTTSYDCSSFNIGTSTESCTVNKGYGEYYVGMSGWVGAATVSIYITTYTY